MNYYKHLIRPLLFRLPAESAHNLTLNLLKYSNLFRYFLEIPSGQSVDLFGIHFKNRVGVAAGLDKNAKVSIELARLGFGFVEIGTVTPQPQEGNPLPRLFRLPQDQAIINRMGFNNLGVETVVKRLKKVRKKDNGIIIGGNIGKNKHTPNGSAWQDYLFCFERLFDYVDYFAVNVSSPNTPDLRNLQQYKPLYLILEKLQNFNQRQYYPKPILLKIAPDLDNFTIDNILKVVQNTKIDGLIATNTTVDSSILHTPCEQVEKVGFGGISGRPLYKKSNSIITYIHQKIPELPLIGVGGIMNTDQAIEKFESGASLIQLYSGFIYEGFDLVYDILKREK